MVIGVLRWYKSTNEPSYSDLADSEKVALRSDQHTTRTRKDQQRIKKGQKEPRNIDFG